MTLMQRWIVFLLITAAVWFWQTGCPIYDSIFDAVETGSAHEVRNYLRYYPKSLNRRDRWGRTPLLVAVTYDRPEVVSVLVQLGADLSAQDTEGNTALHLTFGRENIWWCIDRETDLLLDAGAPLNLPDAEGATAFHHACNTHNVRFVRKFLNHGALATYNTPQYGSPLQHCDTPEILRLLIRNGASVTATDQFGKTPLHYQYEPENIKLLVQHGAAVNAADYSGETPLHDSAITYAQDRTEALLQCGANPNVQNRNGESPLHIAADANNAGVIDLLLRVGADVYQKDKNGHTPLQVAQKRRAKVACALLEEAMNDATGTPINGRH